MQICRFQDPKLGPRMGFVHDHDVFDLTAIDPRGCEDITSWLQLPDPVAHIRDLVELLGRSRQGIRMRELDRKPSDSHRYLLPPIDHQEVWAAGVTFERKKDSILEESRVGGTFYDAVYDAPRPQLFFKTTANRTAGPNGYICIREDSEWTVPESEVAVLVTPDMIPVAYTCGNDVSARDLEGENPLYLQQAKTYVGSCALGPVLKLIDNAEDLHHIEVSMVVIRDEMALFQGEVSTASMTRNYMELIDFLGKSNEFPEGAYLLSGCGVVPPSEFSLEPDDIVEITMSGVGTLRTRVHQT